ncbi:MAG: GMC family oxidoreductase [Gammaproteobacteria bacterium]|jgi:choline dehydrogenase-like flavoprotein
MLIAFTEADDGLLDSVFDICISGTGPAGLPLALKLAGNKRRVLLLEAGGLQFSERSNNVYQGANSGLAYFEPHACRQRFFGGTSNHWGGWCREMHASDFAVRQHVPYSGWPISKADLDPYFAETGRILHVHTPEVADYLLQGGEYSALRKTAFRYSEPPARLGEKFRQDVTRSGNLVCMLNANLVDIDLNENLDTVTAFWLAGYDGKQRSVRARYYVLCHGGIENPRTLLNANRQMKHGVGNSHGLVGRFFMDHPHFTTGFAIVNHAHPALRRLAGVACSSLRPAIYEPTEALQNKEKILSFGLRLAPQPGMCQPDEQTEFRSRLMQFVCNSDALLGPPQNGETTLDNHRSFDVCFKTASEQSPDPESRITLGDELDRFGKRRVVINWQLNELDKRTIRQSAFHAGQIMAADDLGRVRLPQWLLEPELPLPGPSSDEVAGYHHMGTTRMADSPLRGVVDRNQRVFGIDNLYVGGSSVFPSSGHVNPTFTIVQLSLRLADHLDTIIREN